MKLNSAGAFGSLLITLVVLSACGESNQQLSAAHTYSCTELSREIGKLEQRRDTARVNGWISVAEGVFAADSGESLAADIGLAANSIDEADAEKSLEQFQRIYDRKGCI